MNKDNSTKSGKNKINSIDRYVPQYTPSISKQTVLSKQILSKVSLEIQQVKRSVFMKRVTTKNLWNFGLGTQEGINVPIWIIID